jgi:lactoylglutathione lyase
MNPPTTEALDHVALYVRDVPTSANFYEKTLLLSRLPRPAFDFPGAWFRLGVSQELHLIGNRREDDNVMSGSRSNHFALKVLDLDAWEAHFQQKKATYRPPKARPDGIRQIFIQDPDGYWIELCEASPRP